MAEVGNSSVEGWAAGGGLGAWADVKVEAHENGNNHGIFFRLKMETVKTVGKTLQPFSCLFPPVFLFFILFLFFLRKQFTVGLDSKRSRSG